MRCKFMKIVGAILISALSAVGEAAGVNVPTTAEWNGIRLQCTATGGRTKVQTTSEQCRLEMEFRGGITHTVVIKSDELLLTSDALGIKDPQRREVEGCVNVSIVATPDSLAIKCLEQHFASSSSDASSSRNDGSGSSTSRSSSTSISRSTEVKFIEIATWKGKTIELSLEGGNSVEAAIDRDDARCNISFDIDSGKNKRHITLGPTVLTVDGKPHEVGDGYAALFIRATGRGLEVTTDGDVVGTWKIDRQ